MVVIFIGMLVAFFIIVSKLPEDITFSKALDIAGASGKMEVLDFSFNLNNRYTFWSGIIGGTFLMLSYFGTDQSQVQRYLSGKSVKEMQLGLIFNVLLKVPMQFFVLLVTRVDVRSLAVILSAAMSSTSSELNALGSTTTIDLYKRNTSEKTEEEMVRASRWFTFAWGIIAICVANLAENLIQLVNIIGSIFYGNVLGIFLLAFFFKFVKGNAVFIGALITQVLVISLYILDLYDIINLPFLWLNFVGCAIVITIACTLQLFNIYRNGKTITG